MIKHYIAMSDCKNFPDASPGPANTSPWLPCPALSLNTLDLASPGSISNGSGLFQWDQTISVQPNWTQLWQPSSHHPLQRSSILGPDKTHSMQVSSHPEQPCGKRRGSDTLCTHKWYCHRHSNQSPYTWPALEVHQSHGLTTVLKWECQELNNSGLLSHATLVYIPMLLWTILLHYSSPLLDWTGLHLTSSLLTGLAPDLTWEVAVIHLSLMYLFLVIYTY